MKLSFGKDDALQALAPMQGVMASRSMLPILSHLVLEASGGQARVMGSDLELWISSSFPAKVVEEGASTLPGRRFMSIVRELPGQETTLESAADNLTKIRCQKAYFQMMGLGRQEFPAEPDLGDAESIVLKQKELKDILRKTSYAIAQDQSRHVLNGILLAFAGGKLSAVATDGRRLAIAEMEAGAPAELKKEVILPAKAVIELARILADDGEVTVKAGSRQVAFHFPRILLVSRLIEGRYPNYQQVVPTNPKERISLPREIFLQVVRRISLLTSEKSNTVRFSFSPGAVKVEAVNPEVGEAREELAIEYRGGPVEVAFNPQYVMDVLKALDEESVLVEITDSNSPGVFRSDGQFLCVIMPMKLG